MDPIVIAKRVVATGISPGWDKDDWYRELDKRGVPKDAPLYFICRSGNRSRQAAMLATDAGYSRAFNIEFGFEGRLGPNRHRGTAGSWKAEGLPWVQS